MMPHYRQQKHLPETLLLSTGLLCLALILAIFSHPFLKLPFDPWEHLIKIRSIFDTGDCFLFWPQDTSTFCSWHQMWARIFSFLQIDDTLTWAQIIHSSQLFFAFICLFYFARTLFKLCDGDTEPKTLLFMSFFAVLYWLAGNGTYSVDSQQAWVIWYSVTYQGITIPLFWLITTFTLQLLFDSSLSFARRILLTTLVLCGFIIISFFHPSEAIYYLLYLFTGFLFTPHIGIRKKIGYGLVLLIILPGSLYCIASSMHLPFLQGLALEKGFSHLLYQLETTGATIIHGGGNRLTSSFSELAMLASSAWLLFAAIRLIFTTRKLNGICLLLTFLTLLFFLIPTTKWLAGITGTLLHPNIVWRFFYASPWFLFLPLILFTLTTNSRLPKTYASLLLIAILIGTSVFSAKSFTHALSGNMDSLFNSFFSKRMGLQYDEKTLQQLKETIEEQTEGLTKKELILYLRSDLATIARGIWGYYTYSYRRTFIPMHRFYSTGLDKQYQLVPIKLPPGFPKDRAIFLKFNLDEKKISEQQNEKLRGTNPIRFDLDHADIGTKFLFIDGWAFLEKPTSTAEVYIVLQSGKETLIYDTSKQFRSDIGQYFKSQQLEDSGFLATIPKAELSTGTYQVSLFLKKGTRRGIVSTNSTVEIH